jgi:hypothetical protein
MRLHPGTDELFNHFTGNLAHGSERDKLARQNKKKIVHE